MCGGSGENGYNEKPYEHLALFQWTLCMKDWKYDKRHVRSKNVHVRGPLRNKMATLRVISSPSDSDPSADPVPGHTMLPTISLTESDIPGAF